MAFFAYVFTLYLSRNLGLFLDFAHFLLAVMISLFNSLPIYQHFFKGTASRVSLYIRSTTYSSIFCFCCPTKVVFLAIFFVKTVLQGFFNVLVGTDGLSSR